MAPAKASKVEMGVISEPDGALYADACIATFPDGVVWPIVDQQDGMVQLTVGTYALMKSQRKQGSKQATEFGKTRGLAMVWGGWVSAVGLSQKGLRTSYQLLAIPSNRA